MALSILDACASEQLAEADPMRRELINDRCQGELRKVVGKENFVFLKDWKAKVVAKGVNEQGLGWVDLRFSQYVYAVPIANQALDSTSPCFGALAARDVGDVITFSGSMVPLIAASSLPGEGRLSAEVAASAPRGSRVLNINLEEVDGVDCATGRLASRPTPTPFPHPTPVPIPQPSNEEHDPVRPMPPKAIRTGVPYFPPNAVPFSEFMGDAGKPGRSRMMAPPFKAVIREFVTGRDGQRWLRCELSYGKSKPFTGWISESAFVEAAFR